jgi:hypothetical protein
MSEGRFGTAIACIDGRIQQPVTDWLKAHYYLDYVDAVTTPGADKALAEGQAELIEHLKAAAAVSVTKHGSTVLAVVGHYDCTVNPVSREEHVEQIRKALQVVRFWNLPVTLIGLWVNEEWQVEAVAG